MISPLIGQVTSPACQSADRSVESVDRLVRRKTYERTDEDSLTREGKVAFRIAHRGVAENTARRSRFVRALLALARSLRPVNGAGMTSWAYCDAIVRGLPCVVREPHSYRHETECGLRFAA